MDSLSRGMVSPRRVSEETRGRGTFWVGVLQVGAFVGKLCFVIWLLMTVRWTLPCFRYDRLMRPGWKNLFPLALANATVTALVLAIVDATRG
jgi:NADH:ubiquinone oxidoreductase subunit H